MNHTRSTLDVDEQVAEYKNLIRLNHGNVPLIFGETNSLYNEGAPGLSNSFGAALWGVDFSLYAASAGCNRVHMHQGTDYRVIITPVILLTAKNPDRITEMLLSQYQSWQVIDTKNTVTGTKAPYYGNIAVAAALGSVSEECISISNIVLSADTEAAYAVYSGNLLKRLIIINMNGYNTTKDGAGIEPLPNPDPRPIRSFTFTINALEEGHTMPLQRLMANGSDAITGITFDGWSYNMELDNGMPVRLHNVTVGENVKAGKGVVTVEVPDSSAAILTL